MAKTIRILSIDEFKELVNTKTVHIKNSESGTYFATDDNSKRIASVASDVLDALKEGNPIIVLELEDLGDRWFLIVPARTDQPDVAVL